jgi:putative ATPase
MDKEDFSLFSNNSTVPLAERLRPLVLEDFIGQDHVIGENALLTKMIKTGEMSSFILWGPPGVGKTTLAKIISKITNTFFKNLSAVLASINDAKKIMEEAKKNLAVTGRKTILFIDEIHRFNKAQQDAFLSYVEEGTIILIGATTENPSFSIISPLLSRMRVIKLERLKDEDISRLIEKALDFLKLEDGINVLIDADDKKRIVNIASGDARRCYGLIETAVSLAKNGSEALITKDILEKVLQARLPSYDKKDEYHYDYISALHKSMRNSDVDASLYYAVKMLESGEDPLYIIRRVIRFSSEDVGMADPNALQVSIAARDAVMAIGMPEASLAIMQAVAYNALAPKSNALYMAYDEIVKDVRNFPDLPVPMQIRNAPTKLMEEFGYGKDYKYAHNFDMPITDMQCMPDELKDRVYYKPREFGFEKILKERIKKINDIKKNLKKE